MDDRATYMGGTLPPPTDPADAEDVVWRQFSAQFEDYDRAATVNRLAYQSFRVVTLVAGAAITICAALAVPAWLTASLGGVIVVSEGLQQMFQWHANWIAYRSIAEQMRHQAFAFCARTPPYDGVDRRARLAVFRQQVAGTESATWAHRMQHSGEDSTE